MALAIKNPHFILKLISLILLIIAVFVTLQPSGKWGHSLIVEAYTNTSAIVILALIITTMAFESPMITEICLIVACVVMLVLSFSLWSVHQVVSTDHTGAHYIIFTREKDRRDVYLGLTVPVVVLEIVDVILYALKK